MPEPSDNHSPQGARATRIVQLDLLQQGLVDIESIPVERIQPNRWQPRADSDDLDVAELAASIDANGLLQAVIVRPLGGGAYELVAGERRWRAVRLLGWSTIPARVLHHVDEHAAAILALVENVDREDLTPWEEAQAVAGVRERLTASGRPSGGAEMARLFGWSAAKVSERLTIADGVDAAVIERAGWQLHDVKKLPKSLLLKVARARHVGEKVRLLTAAGATAGNHPVPASPRHRSGRPAAPPGGRGRPPAPFTFQARRSGTVSMQLRRPVSELADREARALLERLEPLVAELRERAHPAADAESAGRRPPGTTDGRDAPAAGADGTARDRDAPAAGADGTARDRDAPAAGADGTARDRDEHATAIAYERDEPVPSPQEMPGS
jgi:ParB/RepB/Spo0J family partition protein